MDIPLFSEYGVNYLFRWGHVLFGIVWIGLLYYFNFVQTEYFKEADPAHRSGAIQKLVPRALWWFRWGAAFTFLTGLYLLYVLHGALTYDITVGATLGTLMAFNVWFIIWPNQKIVIASATQVAEGGEALPEAAAAAPKAALASRTNTLFSIPMLFFMGSSAHLPSGIVTDAMAATTASLVAVFAIILILEVNAVRGKQGPMTSVAGVIHCGLGLTAVLYGCMHLL
ncbi:MAG: antitermination protein NusG [Gammaproteobacteria bacterium TMED95]|nr:antitermination protein NusG [Gammaproteobacteria bacterium]OUV19491.1 MAG: antitermination protein NusG [Gammaproteobacteria bacterium TMED95]